MNLFSKVLVFEFASVFYVTSGIASISMIRWPFSQLSILELDLVMHFADQVMIALCMNTSEVSVFCMYASFNCEHILFGHIPKT